MRAGSESYYEEHYQSILNDALTGKLHPGYHFLIRKVRTAAERHLGPERRKVIDVGCGPGYLLVDLKNRGYECYGIDFNPALVKAARERFGLNAEVKDLASLREVNAKFDLALLSHVLEHVEDPAKLLKEIRSVLEPGGILVIEVPNPNYCRQRSDFYRGKLHSNMYPPHHLTFWSRRALQAALDRTGFKVVESAERPYPEKLQLRHSLVHDRNWPDTGFTTAAAAMFHAIGRMLQLSGATLNVVAQAN
jgi:2-polyprenyl-3-methyl-5-hydroxy-6-metoxy-1,4-benzoquinol methylase